MSDRYLWTGTGRPDPFVLRLERELAPVRERVQAAGRHTSAVHGFARVGTVVIAAAAAALALAWLAGGAAAAASKGGVGGVHEPVLPPIAVAVPQPQAEAPREPDDGEPGRGAATR